VTTKAQRNALRLDPNVRERLPTLAHALDLVHRHEQARAAFGLWVDKVASAYDMREVRGFEGFDALERWVQEGRNEP
jgi:hypothetical protein